MNGYFDDDYIPVVHRQLTILHISIIVINLEARRNSYYYLIRSNDIGLVNKKKKKKKKKKTLFQ